MSCCSCCSPVSPCPCKAIQSGSSMLTIGCACSILCRIEADNLVP
jgi:hypothetical protein